MGNKLFYDKTPLSANWSNSISCLLGPIRGLQATLQLAYALVYLAQALLCASNWIHLSCLCGCGHLFLTSTGLWREVLIHFLTTFGGLIRKYYSMPSLPSSLIAYPTISPPSSLAKDEKHIYEGILSDGWSIRMMWNNPENGPNHISEVDAMKNNDSLSLHIWTGLCFLAILKFKWCHIHGFISLWFMEIISLWSVCKHKA